MGFFEGLANVRGKNGPAQAAVILSRTPPEEPTLVVRFEELVAALTGAGVEVQQINSIYDLTQEHPEIRTLQEIQADFLFLGWHYPRALKWILARHDIEVNRPSRKLHCLDVRTGKAAEIAAKVKAILAGEASAEVKAKPQAQGIGQKPPALGAPSAQERGLAAEKELPPPENAKLSPRWYPVIDYDQCTNCMECMDFCLFGVYGVDHAGILRTVQQDQCRQDCPACSRVCPVGAIVFPKYATNQTIAGADDNGDRGNLKLDLSKIFGKPKARHQAALERDRELLKAGRLPAGAEKIEKLASDFDKLEL